MIKINLIGQKKNSEQIIVFGINFKEVNWIFLGIALMLTYALPLLVENYMLPEIRNIENQTSQNQNQIRKMRLKLKTNKLLRKKIILFDKKKSKLITISKTIESIISTRNNPFNVLYFLAKNIPANLWFEKVLIDNYKLVIIGATDNNFNISTLINSINNSYYFKKDSRVSSLENKQKDKNFNFKVETTIERFNE